jgi:hypothetical protein
MSFGRKGLAPGEAAPVAARRIVPAADPVDAIAARREAFLASERARKVSEAGSETGPPDLSSDPLAGLRNGARPATRRDDTVGQSWAPMPEKQVRTAMQDRALGGAGRASTGKRYILGEPSGRSLALAYLFWFVAGQGSLHRFYCGQTQSALMQIGLLVGSVLFALVFVPVAAVGIIIWFLWLLADLFLIPGMLRRFKAEHATDYGAVFA